MSRITTLLLLIWINAVLSSGIKCLPEHDNFLLDSCSGLLNSQDESYCCFDIFNEKVYCCNLMEFVFKLSWFLLMAFIIIMITFSLIFCISCLFCSCCPLYWGREYRKTYGMQVPGEIDVIESPEPTSSEELSEPPSYSEVVYEKQAPYNPNYTSSTQQ